MHGVKSKNKSMMSKEKTNAQILKTNLHTIYKQTKPIKLTTHIKQII